MERTAAAGTHVLLDLDRHIFAWQMIGKSVLA